MTPHKRKSKTAEFEKKNNAVTRKKKKLTIEGTLR